MRKWIAFGLMMWAATPLLAHPLGSLDALTLLKAQKDRVPKLFLNLVNKSIKGRLVAERADYSLPATLDLRGLKLLDPRGNVVGRVKSARFDVAVTELLLGRIAIKDLSVDTPSLKLVLRNNILNLMEALEPVTQSDGQAPDLTVTIEGIRVKNGQFRFVEGESVAVDVGPLSGQASVEVSLRNGDVEVRASKVSARAGKVTLTELAVPFKNIRVREVLFKNDSVRFQGGQLSALNGSSLTVDGNINIAGAGRYDLNGRARIAPNDWVEKLQRLDFDTPAIDARVSMGGILAEPIIDVDGSFGALDAYGYRAKSGSASVRITTEDVRIRSARLRLGEATATNLQATGRYRYSDGMLNLDVQTPGLGLRTALMSADMPKDLRGILSGKASVSGIADGKAKLRIVPELRLRGFKGYSVKAPTLSLTGEVLVNADAVDINARAVAKGTRVDVGGNVNLDRERLSLSLKGYSSDVEGFIPDFPKEIQIGKTEVQGKIEGPYDSVLVTTKVGVDQGEAYGVPFASLSANVRANASKTDITAIKGKLAGGNVAGQLFVNTQRATTLQGTFSLRDNDLQSMRVLDDKSPLPLRGLIKSGRVQLSGKADDPVVGFDAQTTPLLLVGKSLGEDISDEKLGRLFIQGSATSRKVQLSRISLKEGVIDAAGALTYHVEDGAIEGILDATIDKLSDIAALNKNLAGQAKARVLIAGTTTAPNIRGDVEFTKLNAMETALGDGEAQIQLLPESGLYQHEDNLALSGVMALRGELGLIKSRFSYALARERMNIEATLSDLDLALLARVSEDAPKMQGNAFAFLHVSGALDAPTATIEVASADLAVVLKNQSVVSDKSKSKNDISVIPTRPLGALRLAATLNQGAIKLGGCLGPLATIDACNQGEHIRLSGDGRLDLKKESLDLNFDADLSQSRIEDYAVALGELGAGADVDMGATGRVQWEYATDTPPTFDSLLTLRKVKLRVDDVPTVNLQQSARVKIDGAEVEFLDPLRFKGQGGDALLEGKLSTEAVALKLKGNLGLPLVKLYTPEVTTASGQMQADLVVSGTFDELHLSGTLTPLPGSRLGIRALRQEMEFRSGSVSFKFNGATGEQKVNIPSNAPLLADVGEGNLALRGDVSLRYLSDEERLSVSNWNLYLDIQDLLYRDRSSFVETSAKLALKTVAGRPQLSGRVDIEEGSLRSEFGLNNFIVTQVPGPASEPIEEQLAVVNLEDLRLDLRVFVQEYRVRADISTFPLTTVLSGDVALGGTARVPKLEGALEVVTGEFVVPNARFEVATARLEWPKGRAGFVPQITLNATADLPAQGICELDIPIDLTLEGEDLDRLTFELSAPEATHSHGRSELLWAVLGSVPLPACSIDGTESQTDWRVAWRALSSTVSGQVSRELENALQKRVGGSLQINPFFDGERIAADVKWQLGRRIQLEGETGLLAPTEFVDGQEAIPVAGTDVRMRLLIWDPFWFGRALFLEGELSARSETATTSTQLESRFKWRIYED